MLHNNNNSFIFSLFGSPISKIEIVNYYIYFHCCETAMYRVHCTMYNVHCTLYNVINTPNNKTHLKVTDPYKYV